VNPRATVHQPAENDAPYTHRVAVGAYIFHHDRVLLLKRVNPPQTYAPPGGRLNPAEDPLAGLHREVAEETGLKIDIVGLAHIWFGSMDGEQPELLCINFLAECARDNVQLSNEHSHFLWASRDDIASGRVATLNESGHGYRPEDILESFDRYCAWQEAIRKRGHETV
jgi:8-oxo-dGTP diphosphatase